MCRGWTVGTGWRSWLVAGVARSEPEIEQLVLDRRQLGGQSLAQPERQGHADLRVELVHRPVCLDPARILRDPLAATQAGHALVAGLRVDPVELRHRVIVPHRSTGPFAASAAG